MKQTPETVILIDCGYDGIQKVARAVRDKQIYTMVIPCTAPAERVMAENPVGLVFVSGGNVHKKLRGCSIINRQNTASQ